MTGGHHTSALPVINKIKERFPDIDIYWVGHKYSMIHDKNPTLEYREITSLGIPFFELKAGKFYKTRNIGRLLKIPFGFFHAFYYLLRTKPDVILSFGGYIAAPVVVSGYFLGIPSITHEQTVVAGYSNKLISKFAKKVMISWDASRKYFPDNKIVYTGIPLRKSISEIKSNSFSVNTDLPTIYISAGKTGSHIMNEVVLESLEALLKICNVIHQCGDNSVYEDYNSLKGKYEQVKNNVPGRYFLRKFILENEIGEAYSKANLLVSRSGAHTVSEIISLEKPSILIPIPWVSHNEQYENARMVCSYGLGEILEQNSLTSESLTKTVKHSLSNLNLYKIKNNKEEKFPKEDPADLIVNELIRFTKKEK